MLALTTGVAAVAVVVAGLAAGAAAPGLGAFAVGFTGLVGAMVVLAFGAWAARGYRCPFPPCW